MKDCVKNANIRSAKDLTSALITEQINIHLDDVRKESRSRFYESKEKKMEKAFPSKPNTQSLKIQKK